MTISELLKTGENKLSKQRIESPRLEAAILLGHVLKLSRSDIIIKSNIPVSDKDTRDFLNLIDRKLKGEPTAYITANQEFYGRDFYVDSAVLIPRPETEELVEWVSQTHKSLNQVLDLCCGSGCIGITLFLETRINQLFFSDISKDALNVCRKNADKLIKNSNSVFYHSDLFDSIKKNSFDLIVSNPPYVTKEEYEILEHSVFNFEPKTALLVENPGLFNLKLIRQSFDRLISNGWLYLESSPFLITSLKQIFLNTGFTDIETMRDLSRKERFIRGRKP